LFAKNYHNSIRSSSMRRLMTFGTVLLLAGLTSGLSADEKDVSLDQLIQTVKNGEQADVIVAIDEIASFGPDGAPAVPALIQALSGNVEDVVWRAARTLGAIAPNDADAIAALVSVLESESPKSRAYAAFALGRIGEPAQSAAPALIKLAVDEDLYVRRAVRDALRLIKAPREQTLPLMVATLESADPAQVTAALQTFAELGEEALPTLSEALKHPKACYWACLVLADMGPAAKPTVPLIMDVLDHEHAECRMQALVTLGKIGPGAAAAVPKIIDLLKNDEFGAVKAAAAFALVSIGAKSDDVIAALLEARGSDDELTRVVAAWSLIELRREDEANVKESIDIILEGLKSEQQQIRAMAARALIEGEAPDELVIPAFLEALKNADDETVFQVVEGLASFGARAVPRVAGALQNDQLRHLAVEVLRRVDPEAAKAAIPDMIKALETDDPVFKYEVQFLLGTLGPAAAPAVDSLVKSLSDEDEKVRRSACFSLGKIGPAAKSAVDDLVNMFRTSTEQYDKIASIWALLNIRPDSQMLREFATPILIPGLDHKMDVVRMEVAATLGNIGPLASKALPKLNELLQDESPHVREAAAEAIKKIQP
jgi:HEAT repeat protein